MIPVPPWARDAVPVPTGRQAAEFDRGAIEGGIPGELLMERAGVHAAELLLELYGRPVDRPVLVIAGLGNNGGDGLVLARALCSWGVEVHVVRPRASDAGLDRLHGHEVAVHDASGMADETLHALVSTASVVVDALLGTGLTEAPREDAQRLIDATTHARGPVVALDLPSGAIADDGRVPTRAVQADATFAFGFPKLGSLLHPARAHAGRLVVVDIGFPPVRSRSGGAERWYEALTPDWARRRRPRRRPEAHKNTAGAVLVVAGSEGMAGAALLAARSALRAGAGYLRLAAPPALRDTVQAAAPEVVFVDRTDGAALDEALHLSGGVVLGPGLGTGAEAASVVERVLHARRPTVVDADALTLLAGNAALLPEARGVRDGFVHTPHPGEAGRLLGCTTADVQADRPGALEALSSRLGGTVVLKGAPTLVAAGERRLVDTLGSSDLAVAGMGDTLAGAAGALLSQGAGPLDAAGIGLVLTARAAALAGAGEGLTADDVAAHLPEALAEPPAAPTLSAPFVTFDLAPPR